MTSLTWSGISTTAWVVYTSLQATSAFRVRERIVVTVERRREQNVCVWTETEGTRQGYYLRVLLWSSIDITVSWSFAKKISLRESEVWRKRFSNKLITRVTQDFNVFFPLPSFCVSSQMDGRKESCLQRSNIRARNAHEIAFYDGKSFTNCRRCGGFQRCNFWILSPFNRTEMLF